MKKPVIVLILIVVLVFGVFMYWTSGNRAVNPNDKSTKMFVINKGAGIREIGNNLKEQGLIRDPVVFFINIKLNGLDKNIQAGDFKLSPSMTLAQIMDNLNHGIVDLWVTFPEGVRGEEVADILKENVPSYDESWRPILIENEGYLFPDTYLIPKDAAVEMVVSLMKNNFNKKLTEANLSSDSANLDEIVTVASLIEREAITDEEKPLIAGVINNRLDLGMALQIDATIQYAKGYDGKKWWGTVYREDYQGFNSPYNTYLRPGLPPTPIANPGIEAIKAAANPQNNNYLYYIHDTNGKIHPAETIEEHNDNVQKYL